MTTPPNPPGSSPELPRNQHYVPQFLLRHFAVGAKHQLHVFDKHTERTFRAAVRNVAAARDFNNFVEPPGTAALAGAAPDAPGVSTASATPASLEPLLGQLEDAAAPLVQRIVTEARIDWLTPSARRTLALFTCVQMFRVPMSREAYADTSRLLRAFVAGHSPEAAAAIPEPTAAEVRAQELRQVTQAPEFAPLLLDKVWVLRRAPIAAPFWTSDNPVTLHNHLPRPGRGSLGLRVPGIEVALPLSPRLCLTMVCPGLMERVRRGVREVAARRARGHPLPGDMAALESLWDATRRGRPYDLAPEHVDHHNSLQVGNSVRFVYASTGDFAVARDMVASHAEVRQGWRVVDAARAAERPDDAETS